MTLTHNASTLRAIRDLPQWRLLASENAPAVLAILRELLFERDTELPTRLFLERLAAALEDVKAIGYELSRTAAAYASEWVRSGWLTRRLRQDGAEEIFELTPDAAAAIRYVNALERPQAFATESRLASVIAQTTRLADETDTDPTSRLKSLVAERTRIDAQIEAVRAGDFEVLQPERAIELAREILHQADALVSDFRRVRDEFDQLSRQIRESLITDTSNRGEVLGEFFTGMDEVRNSEAGRAFTALWRLLNEATQRFAFESAIEAVVARPFTRELDETDRQSLRQLLDSLLDEASRSNGVMLQVSRSLKSFVQSREYLEQRRINSLLKAALSAALEARDRLRPFTLIEGYRLMRTSADVRSPAKWHLFNPRLGYASTDMSLQEEASVDAAKIQELMRHAEIDMAELMDHIREAVGRRSPISVGAVLELFPASQGLGSVAGLLSLATKHGFEASGTEAVGWTGADGRNRRARIPLVYFVKERVQ